MERKERLKRGLLTVGELGREVGLSPSTVRYYNLLGIVEPVARTKGGYRLYDKKEALPKLMEIKRIRESYLSLIQIKERMEEEYNPPSEEAE